MDSAAREAEHVSAEALRDMPVLLVDDNATSRNILAEMLEVWGMVPTMVDSGSTAFRLSEQAASAAQPFSIVLLDANMPDVDSFALAAAIRNAKSASTTIMMLNSDRQAVDAARCRDVGVAYIVKPVTEPEILRLALSLLAPEAVETPYAAPPQRISSHENSPKLRILLAEDNLVNQKLAVRILEKLGHTVIVANNGREAVEIVKLQADEINLVLMDIQMPKMNGLEATAAIRAWDQARHAHTPIIAMTANAMKGDAERCFAAGMDGYTSKPIDRAQLLQEIAKHVKRTPAAVLGEH